ncbi:MAG: DUF4154 domain-containing protein [Cyclobacteriaceae bacterium]
MLYLDESSCSSLSTVFSQNIDRPTLLVSEKCTRRSFMMLNIILDETKDLVSFEVNRNNILGANLEIDPNLLVYGGSEVDIKKLVVELELELQNQQDFISKSLKKVEELQLTIINNEQKNQHLNYLINQLTDSLNLTENQLHLVNNQIAQHRLELRDQLTTISEQDANILQQQTVIKQQSLEMTNILDLIDERKKDLDNLITASIDLNQTISDNQKLLSTKEKMIEDQQNTIALTITTLMLIGLLLLTTIYWIIKRR